jgi:hypothetical protein
VVVSMGVVCLDVEVAYAAGSCRKLKSLDGMSSMPRETPFCGDSALD